MILHKILHQLIHLMKIHKEQISGNQFLHSILFLQSDSRRLIHTGST